MASWWQQTTKLTLFFSLFMSDINVRGLLGFEDLFKMSVLHAHHCFATRQLHKFDTLYQPSVRTSYSLMLKTV